jgi:uncharacterized protein YbaA (DUF1428 family)
MPQYVDGFVVPVCRSRLEDYRHMAQEAGRLWREHGAIEFRECLAEDVKVGELTSFPRSVQLEPDETVVFSWIVFESRAERDRINGLVTKDPRFARMMDTKNYPFDGKRMIYGGFEVLVDA